MPLRLRVSFGRAIFAKLGKEMRSSQELRGLATSPEMQRRRFFLSLRRRFGSTKPTSQSICEPHNARFVFYTAEQRRRLIVKQGGARLELLPLFFGGKCMKV